MLKRIDNPEAKEMCRPHITYNNDSRKPVRRTQKTFTSTSGKKCKWPINIGKGAGLPEK